MRRLAIMLILAGLAMPAIAQNQKVSQDALQIQHKQAEKAAVVLRELAQVDYKATMDIPVTDGLFVDDGKLLAPIYHAAIKQNGVALKAGNVTKITDVKVMDFGIQINLVSDSCILFGSAGNKSDTANQSVDELLALGKKTLAALFEPVPKQQ